MKKTVVKFGDPIRLEESQMHAPAVIANPQVMSDASRVIEAITKAALNPNVDVEKMERMKALYMEMRADAARVAFMSALADFQSLKQTIATNRKGEGPGGSVFDYADWPQMEDAVRPWLAQCGLFIHMTQGEPVIDGRRIIGVMVYGWLSHRDGHEGERIPMFAVPNPAVEMKLSPMQAIQQGVTYVKRQIASLLLGVAAREDRQDHDADPPADQPTDDQPRADWQLDEAQRSTLFDLMAAWEPSDDQKRMLLAWLKVSDVENIHREKFETVAAKLRQKIAEKK